MKAADARRALPCWDEPAIKATFDVTIIADQSKTVLSNMVLKLKRKGSYNFGETFVSIKLKIVIGLP